MDVEHKIYFLRGRRVLLDRDLALLYGVPVKRLNEQVKRNINRFPNDFMFQLTKEEAEWFMRSQSATSRDEDGLDKPNLKYQTGTSSGNKILKSQIATSKETHGGRRKLPYAFTEQGVAMLSSVLKSERAIQANIQIMRTFTKIREMLVSNDELRQKIEILEEKYDQNFAIVFKAIKELMSESEKPKKQIGFRTE